MKMRKRICSAVLALSMTLQLAGCLFRPEEEIADVVQMVERLTGVDLGIGGEDREEISSDGEVQAAPDWYVSDSMMGVRPEEEIPAADEEEALAALCDEVFPLCRLVTPNLNEAERLLGHPVTTVEEMEQGAEELFRRYGCAFLVKGGHLAGDRMTDVLCDGAISRFDSPRIATGNLHGTGCTLSSAIATGLASGRTLREAVGQGKAYMDRAIAAARDLHIGSGNGPLWHFPDRR